MWRDITDFFLWGVVCVSVCVAPINTGEGCHDRIHGPITSAVNLLTRAQRKFEVRHGGKVKLIKSSRGKVSKLCGCAAPQGVRKNKC